MHWLEFLWLTWALPETYKLVFGWEFHCKLQNTTTCTIQNCKARWSIPSPFAFKMPWKHRGSRQNTLSALESCDSSSFPYEDPGDCLLSIHQRQWIGWAATAARNPQHRARAIPLHMQRLWSWIVLNREPSGWASHVCPGGAATLAPLKSNAVSAGILQQAPLPRGSSPAEAFAASAGRDTTSSPGAVARAAWFLLLFLKEVEGFAVTGTVWFALCGCVGVAGECLLCVLCWTRTARFGGISVLIFSVFGQSWCLIT